MKLIRKVINDSFCTFSVLSMIIAVLCSVGYLQELPYTEIIYPIALMSVGTTLFVSLREVIFPQLGAIKYVFEILGCTIIILAILWYVGWMEFNFSYFIVNLAIVVSVYLLVWLLTWIQSKRDEDTLNSLLKHQREKQLEKENKK